MHVPSNTFDDGARGPPMAAMKLAMAVSLMLLGTCTVRPSCRLGHASGAGPNYI
jgi:hypothetical protein